MKKVQPLLLVAVLSLGSAAVTTIAGCKTTTSAGTQVDDAGIKVAVKAKLTEVRASTWTNVEVNSTNGVVTLAGQVATDADRREAETLARSVKGVVRVNNALQVKPQ